MFSPAHRVLRLPVLILAGVGLSVAPGWASRFHTSPECWDEPRMFHAGSPPAELANRIHLIETPASVTPPGMASESADGARRFWVRNPDTSAPGPWGAAVVVDSGQAQRPTLMVENVAGPILPRWLNERLIFVRIQWGRVTFTDIILDAETRELRYHEVVHDGGEAYAQYQAACGGRCDCPSGAVETSPAADPFGVDAPIPSASAGAGALIGLLELPTVFGPPEQGGVVPADEPRPVPVFAEPLESASPLAALVDLPQFEYREYTYEGAAAVVYRRVAGWYEIGVKMKARKRAWVREASAGAFMPIGELLLARPAYLNERWDGHLWSTPGGDARRTGAPSRLRSAVADGGRVEVSVQVVEVREVGNGLWLRVETREGSGCGDEAPIVDRGWVPAYDASGQLVAGYHSRGC